VRTPAPDPGPTTGLPRSFHGPTVSTTEAPPAPGTRTAASLEGTGTVPKDSFRYSSRIKTGDEPAPNPAEAREGFTVPDMGPGTAAAVGMTEPAAIGFPITPAATSEAAGGLGGGPGLGGRPRPGRPLGCIVQQEKNSKILSVFFSRSAKNLPFSSRS
jgi:hypothetical protein